jgi:hypothetical protein
LQAVNALACLQALIASQTSTETTTKINVELEEFNNKTIDFQVLRSRLYGIFTNEHNSFTPQLASAIYSALLALTQAYPLNIRVNGKYEDPVDYETLDGSSSIALSTGWIISVKSLLTLPNKNGTISNPATAAGELFNPDDYKRIVTIQNYNLYTSIPFNSRTITANFRKLAQQIVTTSDELKPTFWDKNDSTPLLNLINVDPADIQLNNFNPEISLTSTQEFLLSTLRWADLCTEEERTRCADFIASIYQLTLALTTTVSASGTTWVVKHNFPR